MGSKFCNLNIRSEDLLAVKTRSPGFSVRAVIPGWTTVSSDKIDWCKIRKLAKKLSFDWPVLYTEYFDDDFVEFSVYRDGKRAARHIPAEYEGVSRSPGKPRAWAEVFGFSSDTEKTLRTVFQESNPEVSLRLLECILNCPLWVVEESMSHIRLPEQDYLRDYLTRKEAEKKIKNVTKLTLLDEQEGDFARTYPLVRNEDIGRKSFWAVRAGKLKCLFETELCGIVENACAGEGVFLVTVYDFYQDGSDVPISNRNFRTSHEVHNLAMVFSDTGELLEELDMGATALNCAGFLDRDRLFLNGICHNLCTHSQEWELKMAKSSYCGIHPPCRIRDGRIAMLCLTMEDSAAVHLVSFLPDGSEWVTQELPDTRYDGCLLAYEDGLLLSRRSELICYDSVLSERWRVQLRQDGMDFHIAQLDESSELLYLYAYDLVLSFDLTQRQTRASRNLSDGESFYLQSVLPGVGVVMLTGDSTFQVWDPDLNLISRHRTKGVATQFLFQNGAVNIISNADVRSDFRKVGDEWNLVQVGNGHLRLYELKK